MPMPTTHVIISLIFFYPLRKYFGKYWHLFAIISGLLPDFDFALDLLLKGFGFDPGFLGHGGFFHSTGFILLIGAISAIIFIKNKEYGKYGFILTIGSTLHILTDLILGGGGYSLMIFYPFSENLFRIHLLEQYRNIDIFGILDAILIMTLTTFLFFKQRKQHNK